MFAALDDSLAGADAKVGAMERGEVDVVPFGSEDRTASSLARDALKPTGVALEAGNSAAMIFKHCRELVRPAAAQEWFVIVPEKKVEA